MKYSRQTAEQAMAVSNTANKPTDVEKKSRLRAIAVLLLTIFLAIGITAGLFLFRDKVSSLGNYGYLGAFLIGLVTSATVIIPVPGIVVLFALGATLNPVLVGLVGAAGGILGEITGFVVGHEGRKVVQNPGKLYLKMEGWMRRWGSWAVFFFAAAPIPLFDVAGIISGALGYPLWKFLLIGWAGKSIKFVILVAAGAWGWQAMLRFFN